MTRTIILLLDSLGIGQSEDAKKFNDEGSNTLGHIIEKFPDIKLPNLSSLGLINALNASCGNTFGKSLDNNPKSLWGYAKEISSGKDTPSGHWELMGCPVLFDWGYFTSPQNSFPKKLLDKIYQAGNIVGSLGNCIASGTEIIDKYGMEHLKTGLPIFYTSADSVFQIAVSEETFGLDNLYKLCEIARQELYEYNIGRVIARPFVGKKLGEFKRTGNRKDYAITPHSPTLLDVAKNNFLEVISIGKIADIFANSGITHKYKATGLQELFAQTLQSIDKHTNNSIIFTNFVDFDSEYGHRRDVKGYKEALEYFDENLPKILNKLQKNDLLVITADHGCDPTYRGTNHTREHIPVIFYGENIKPQEINMCESFSDVGQSIATFLNLPQLPYGKSFLNNTN